MCSLSSAAARLSVVALCVLYRKSSVMSLRAVAASPRSVAATNDSTSVLATLTPGEITRTTAALRVLLDTCQTIDTSETTTEQSQSPCPLALPDWLIVAEKLLRVQGEAAASA